MNNYFDFIIYSAFKTAVKYENKRRLTLEELHNYRIKLLEQDIAYYSQYDEFDDKDFEECLRYFHSANMNMTMEEEKSNFLKFIKDNSKFFVYNNGVITLKEGITYDELSDAGFELDSYSDKYDKLICGGLISFDDCVECLDVLGLHKIKDFVHKIVVDEKKIEKAYDICPLDELGENIEKWLTNVNYKLALIGNLNDQKMGCYGRTIVSSGKSDPDTKGEDFYLLSEEIEDNDEFLELNKSYIGCILLSIFQKAIFDTGSLAYARLNDIMDALWAYREPEAEMEIEPVDSEAFCTALAEKQEQAEMYEDEFDDDDDDYDDYDEEDDMDQVEYYLHDKKVKMAFYLNYIDKINKYQEKHGYVSNLERAKRRLLYILDGYGDNLYNEDNFNTALNNVSMDDINYKDDFYDFYLMSRLFLVDYLEYQYDDERTVRKMLFASTYYDLTHDDRIRKIVNKYKKTENGQKVRTCIIGHDFEPFVEDTSDKPKEMIKKNPKDNAGKKE